MYEAFNKAEDTIDRQRFFKKWTIEPLVMFGLASLIILYFIDKFSAINIMPNFLLEISTSIKSSSLEESGFISGLMSTFHYLLVPILLLTNTAVTILNAKKDAQESTQKNKENFRNLNALFPRNFKERIWGFWLSINAGFSEELFFRLVAPILIYGSTGSAWAAIIGSTIWFGLAHYYQGVSGIFGTIFAGFLLFLIYLITESIWIAMLVHAVIDINSLVLGPWLKDRYARG